MSFAYEFNEKISVTAGHSIDLAYPPSYFPVIFDKEAVIMGHTAASYHLIVTQNSTLARAYSRVYKGMLEYSDGRFINFVPFPRKLKSIPLDVQGICLSTEGFYYTDIERTLVDMMQFPEFSGGTDEILEAYECGTLQSIDWDKFLSYVDLWGTATLYKRLAYLLSYYASRWNVPTYVTDKLRQTGYELEVELFWGSSTQYNIEWKMWVVDLEQLLNSEQ